MDVPPIFSRPVNTSHTGLATAYYVLRVLYNSTRSMKPDRWMLVCATYDPTSTVLTFFSRLGDAQKA